MKIWNLIPVLRLLIPFTGGIILQLFYQLNLITLLTGVCFAVIILLSTLLFQTAQQQWKYRWLNGVGFTLLFFCLGSICSFIEKDTNQSTHFQYLEGTIYLASVDEPFVEKANSYKTIARVIAVKHNNVWINTTGKLLVYVSKAQFDPSVKYGDCFVFAAQPQEVLPPQNPDEFNYKRFLSFHNVFQQVYLAPDNWKKINVNIGKPILATAYYLRNKLVSILRSAIPGNREFAVASALVVGYEDALDADLINAYSSSGALHVLSVSGMHVGAIYVVLTFLLKGFKKRRWTNILRFVFLLSFLWWYALITGFSPSVLRSAAMLSIVIIGEWLRSNSGIMNTLAVSVFVLLIYNPFMITEVGFQLSYLAVFGIVYLHPKLFQQWIMPNKFLYYVWQITSVSICAQLMTFPLGLLYFHQFPNFFVISNLIIIPLTTGIIYACILLMTVSGVQVIGAVLAKICEGAIWFVNQTVLMVDKIPYAVSNGISINIIETWLIYILIFFGLFYVMQKRAIMLQGFLAVSIILIALQINENLIINKQSRVVVYKINNHSAIDFVEGKQNTFITDSVFHKDKNAIRFHIRQHWWKNGLYETKPFLSGSETQITDVAYYAHSPFLFFNNQTWIKVDSNYAKYLSGVDVPAQPYKVDVVLLSENARVSLKRLQKFISAPKIIIDSSNKKWKAEKWMKEADSLQLYCYSVLHSGAYVHELNR